MKLGDVLKKEREKKKLSAEEVADTLDLSVEEYQAMEAGDSPIEEWGPRLALIAIKLETPTSRFISETGKSADANQEEGQCGKRITQHREKRNITQEQLAEGIEVSTEELIRIENGDSPLETYAPLLLHFAELIDQPIFNLFYPCGLPFAELDDYP